MKLLELEPHSVMASAKDGFIEEIMQSEKIWDCIGCYKCIERCPQKMSPVDLMYIMKNWCVSSGKQLPGDYQKMLQNILSTGFTQPPLPVRDVHNKTFTRESLGLPDLKRPENQEKFSKAVSELAMEELQ